MVQAASVSGPPPTVRSRGRRRPPSASSVSTNGARVARETSQLCDECARLLDVVDVEPSGVDGLATAEGAHVFDEPRLGRVDVHEDHALLALEPLALARPADDRLR
jgi:hypothetical protein